MAEGARVCLTGLVTEELRAGAAELGPAAIFAPADVTSSMQVKTAVSRAAEVFGASVIITSSVVGLTSDAGICAYATAKHALVGLMRTLAKETAPRGIRVNTIHPGPVDNEFQHRIEVAATGAERDPHRGRRNVNLRTQMTGGRPALVIRQAVRSEMGRRGPGSVRQPSAKPANQGFSGPSWPRDLTTVSAIQSAR